MMIYSDKSQAPMTAPFDPLRCNANKHFLTHYDNHLYLKFMEQMGTAAEKRQARAELEICARKMKYWERQPHFNQAEALREQQARRRAWDAREPAHLSEE